MTKNRKIILDGSKINSARDFHEQIAKLLDFGPYYGHNIHALWDMMSAGVELKVDLHWVDYAHSKKMLGEEYMSYIINVFEDVISFYKEIHHEGEFRYFLE